MANIIVHQVGFQHSEALELFVMSKLRGLQRREQSGDRLWEIEAYLKAVSRSPARQATSYSARIAIKLPWQPRRVVTSADAPRPRPALTAALEKMEKRLRRDSRKYETGRRTVGHTKRATRTLARTSR